MPRLGRRARDSAKRAILVLHKALLRCGVIVLPVHYYAPVTSLRELEKTRGLWEHKSELPGIAVDIDGQIARLEGICVPYREEYAGNAEYKRAVGLGAGPGYGFIEAQVLHAFVRAQKPRRVLEIGSGVSTLCIAQAAARNEAEGPHACEITCVEPYPSEVLTRMQGVTLMSIPVQKVPLDVFAQLDRGDLLFIDSSHAVKVGGDVNYLVLEVLPRLKPGVIVHFHDIYLPYDYPRDVLQTFYHGQETSLVRAYLIGNPSVRILFCLSQLHYERPEALAALFPEYDPEPSTDGVAPGPAFSQTALHFPSALYLEVVARP
jgi:hypothetical protein